MAKILVTGACGYKGHILIPKLLNMNHEIVAIDTQWFGNFLAPHPNLNIIKLDLTDYDNVPLVGIDTIIHLASIANDPCGDLNPKLTWEVSALATMKLADRAVKSGVKRFIYASSGSVYGIRDEEQVTEDVDLTPLSEYNKTKMVGERVVLSYSKEMVVQIIRPATVCGISPRMRLDVSVNLLTMQALKNGKITVFGGDQVRPNIHIDDITDVYIHFLKNPQFSGIYNAGFENMSILEIANLVKKHVGADIEVTPSNDPRSYRLNSDKLLSTGFKPKKCIEDAIIEITKNFQAGLLKDEVHFYNLNWMLETGILKEVKYAN